VPYKNDSEPDHSPAADSAASPSVSVATEQQYPLAPSVIDARSYTDEQQFKREIEHIFHRVWFPVCPSVDLKNARDYVVWDQLKQSIVVVRLDDGRAVAWHNVCQHRGARLIGQSGHCDLARFTCPWHGFTYDLEGKLRLATLRQSFDAALLSDLRTVAVRVQEWSGFIWICLAEEGPDLKSYLGVIWDELEFYGMQHFETRFRFELKLNANWKTVVDAFNETWHVPFTHADTLSKLVRWRDARLKIAQPHSWMTLPIRGFTERAGEHADHRSANVCHYLAFPNTIFSCFPTHLQTWNIWPVSVTETLLTAWGVVGPAPPEVTAEQWRVQNERDWQHFCDVSAEDAKVLNGWGTVSHSLGARRYMFNTAEGRLTAFHQEVRRRTAGG
jgi:phenylpropionate dioxygenase-like ring-hydroxylating dioxygenase large terminal subunit